MKYEPLHTAWTRSLKDGVEPTEYQLRDHLLAVHSRYAGFTESCAVRCKDDSGSNSYERLAELADPDTKILDLACGSGVLLELCHSRLGGAAKLVGVDMSSDELALARTRVGEHATLKLGLAQDLSFAEPAEFDAVLCHWAMTLMHPIEPVLREVQRVLRPGGLFAAIVDGDQTLSDIYQRLNQLIFNWVATEYPAYGRYDLGDARVRQRDELTRLVQHCFPSADLEVQPTVVRMSDAPAVLAREAVGFYYASFVLSEESHAGLLREVESFFSKHRTFEMPIRRLVVRN